MSNVIVEYAYDPPLSEDDFVRNGQKLGPCLEARSVKWVATYLSIDRRRRVCIFDAPDAEAVRSAFHSAGVKFERAWSSTHYGP